jgi:hypothetical protein
MSRRPRLVGSRSVLRVAAEVFALTAAEPTQVFLSREDVAEQERAGLPAGRILLPALRGLLLRPDTTAATRDGVWRVLVCRARAEGPAWTVAAVGMALPGLSRAVRMLSMGFTGEQDDLESAVLEGFLAELSRIDLTAHGLGGRLVRAGHKAGLRQVYQDAPAWGVSGSGFASQTPPTPWGHPDLVLVDAVTAGVLSREEAWLIGVTRLEDTPIELIAEAWGQRTNTLVVRRHRCEHRLRDAIVQGQLSRDRLTGHDARQARRGHPASGGGGV